MAVLAVSQALQSRSAYFPGDSQGDASSNTTVNTSASQPTQDAAPLSSHSNPAISRASFASASRHKSAQVQSSSAVRAWRFPSSRRFLWDRTATGPCVHLHPQVICVKVLWLCASDSSTLHDNNVLCTGFPAGCHSQAASFQVFTRADWCHKTAACTSCVACGSHQCCFTGSWSR